MTASLLKKLLQFEQRLEKDNIGFLSKDWITLWKEGSFLEDEKIITNSYTNSQRSEQNLHFIPKKPSLRKRLGIRWNNKLHIFGEEE